MLRGDTLFILRHIVSVQHSQTTTEKGVAEKIPKDKIERVLSELKRRNRKKESTAVEEERIKLVIFSLGSDYYAFQGDAVKEILSFKKIYYVPGCPDVILGIINVRGDIYSVVNIHKILGFSDAISTDHSRIVIADRGGISSGILVDSVEHVVDVPINLIKPSISTLDESIRDLVAGETDYDNKAITLLDVRNIFRKLIH